jgi:CheY-like chemotaxis protein
VSDLKTSRLIAGHSGGVEGVLMNLIFNAVDAMPQGGRINIRTYDEGDWVCMSVSDTGTGMDQKTRERLGELFFTTKTNGHGIGLATCFRTVRDLSGTIEVESAPGKGSTFLLRFPALAQIHSDPIPAPVGSTTSCRILVIDDEISIQSFLLQALSKHVVDAVGDGETGLDMFRENPYDVVFIDLSLPGIDGVAVAQHMRTLSDNVSLVLMTGWEKLSEETNAHFHAVLNKPFSLHALIGLVNDLLKKQEPGNS